MALEISKRRVVPYMIEVKCPKCHVRMAKSCESLLSDPSKHTYVCPKCGYTDTSSVNDGEIIYDEYVGFSHSEIKENNNYD